MKIANPDGRAVLVIGDELAAVETASGGAFRSDPTAVYERWGAFVEAASAVTSGTGPLHEPKTWIEGIGTRRNRCV